MIKTVSLNLQSKKIKDAILTQNKLKFMKTLANKEIIESTALFVNLSNDLLERIDLFLLNTNLDISQQKRLMSIFKEIYDQGYENCVID